jgi:N,N'-diacetyllegionaminate synthase
VSVLVIAEAGVNHNGDLATALRLVDAAADAGADVVKFQTFNADRLVTRTARKAAYQEQTTGSDESQHDMLSRLELDEAMHRTIADRCEVRGIEFASTAFDCESVDLLAELGVRRFKIPSGEITNLPYLRHVARYGRPIILSTGMSSLAEIDDALAVLEQAGTARRLITALHCTTAYPAPPEDVNLRAMLTIRDRCGVAVGYSDHTTGIEVSMAAVALGAEVVEKHLTLDREMAGPDHLASLVPGEFNALVKGIRTIELSLGTAAKGLASSEIANRDVARRSLVARRAIQAGEVFSEHNLTAKRPGTGISPMRYDDVIGRTASRSFEADELIEL